MIRAFIAAVLLAGITPAAVEPNWSVARSPHFEVYTSGAPERASEALAMFENARTFFTSYLQLPESSRPPIRVILFSGAKEFEPYKTTESAAAFYQPGRDHDYIVFKDFNADSFDVVAHEYAHAALGLKGAEFPPWLSEGLAEFFSSVELVSNKARIGGVPEGRLKSLRPAALMAMQDLLAVTRQSPAYNGRNHAELFYAQSWALTHMLFIDSRYRDGMSRVLALAQTGADSAKVMTEIYGKGLAEIERDFRAYVGRGTYQFFTVDSPRAAAATRVRAVPIPSFDAGLVLADCLASEIGKDVLARAAFEALAKERPDDLALVETRAFFEQKTLGPNAADVYFARAVERGSRNPLVLSEYALHLVDRDPERASALLAQAVAIAPGDLEVRVHAAAVLMKRQLPEEALAMVARTTRVPPSLQFEYYQIIANGRAATGDFDEATAAAARVVAAARTPEEIRFAAGLMTSVGGPPDVSKIIEGRLKNLNCDGATPILEVAVGGLVLKLALDDPTQVVIAGGAAMKIDLDCGEQDTPLRVGYSEVKPPEGTVGRVRFLDFRKKSSEF